MELVCASTSTPQVLTQLRIPWRLAAIIVVVVLSEFGVSDVFADELSDAFGQYHAGNYDECRAAAAREIGEGEWREEWRILKINAELATGEFEAALQTFQEALPRYSSSIMLRFAGRRVMLMNDRPQDAAMLLNEIDAMARQTPWRYSDPSGLIILGRTLLLRDEDPRQVLEAFFDRAKKMRPDFAEAYVASAELALNKHDYALAAESLEQALKLTPENPDIYCQLARSYEPTDSDKASECLKKALEINPNHAESLLLQVDQLIDAEKYEEATAGIDQILNVNLREPRAWAYLAVVAHLNADEQGERLWRSAALSPWKTNPEVDHLIGRKLSQKYRFAEGAEYQRRSLQLDASYLPAKAQLSQDLLRLGDEEEGWRLANEVHNRDAYDVLAYNLMTLRDRITSFRTIDALDDQGRGFIVRMSAKEADIYGQRVVNLLKEAQAALCEKYDVKLEKPIIVEIFDEQKDFAIRTFGLPGGAGFLGVCFGSLITANSPAAQGDIVSNWEATLWHEFCHVVTLQKTNNKMPRWLSEGISVYEERQANPAWGEAMTPRYREMILNGELTPVSQLSSAFLNPPSAVHLQFAYFESSLVVDFLIAKYGLETLQRILVDLGVGMPINDALSRYAGSLATLDQEFADFIRKKAESHAPELDWTKPDLPPTAHVASWEKWVADHPKNFAALQALSVKLIEEERFAEAKTPLKTLQSLYPEHVGANNAYELLARVHRALNEAADERRVLGEWVSRADDASAAYLRLAELAAQEEDWKTVQTNAERMLAVDPLVRAPHEFMSQAAEAQNDSQTAITAYQALLVLDPLDPAEIHFRLAKHLNDQGNPSSARRHVLQALEEAPRFRDGHRLLLKIVDQTEAPHNKPSESSGESSVSPIAN
jgi:predicted Zn-dependent protease